MKTKIGSVLLLTCLFLTAVAGKMQAVLPPPDGGYPGFNTAEGQNALFSLTTGSANTAVGWFSLFSDTEGSFNTATGAGALLFNANDNNTAFGAAALLFNTTGSSNTAVGTAALLNNTGGHSNTATGEFALSSNMTGNQNTANGLSALFNNTTGSGNTAMGTSALHENTTGFNNTANGFQALFSNTTGANNTASGVLALQNNTTGDANTANGVNALVANTTGDSNTAYGFGALFANTAGSHNIGLGRGAGISVITANDVIAIGTDGQDVDNSCFIGQIYTNIQPQVGTDPDTVTINSNGRLGRANVSSRRYKHDIQPMHDASEAIYELKPVTFRYHEQYDRTQTIAFGLIAEEVAEVYPDLVGRNPKGQPESVRYEQINAMLLNEFLKEHRKNEEQNDKLEGQARKIQEQETTIAQLKSGMETLAATVNDQASQLEKVSARLQIHDAAPRAIVTNH